MSTNAAAETTTGFKVGWWILIVLSVLSFVNHASLIFILAGEEVLFLGWAAFNLFSTAVLYIPYRRLEPWAWWMTWVLVIPYAAAILFDSQIGPFYFGAAVLMAVGQVLTSGSFRR